MRKIFVSFCNDDGDCVKNINEIIKQYQPNKNVGIFFTREPDKGVSVGRDILNSIDKELTSHNCKAVLLFVTCNYMKSMYCLYELSVAMHLNKNIIPIIFNKEVSKDIAKIIGNNVKTINIYEESWENSLYLALKNVFCFQKPFSNADKDLFSRLVDIKPNYDRDYIGADADYKNTYRYMCKNGIKSISNESLSGEVLSAKIKNARNVKIISTTGHSLLEKIQESLTNVLINKGNIYFLLPNKYSTFCENVAEIESVNYSKSNFERISQEFTDSITILNTIIDNSRAKTTDIGHVYVGCSHNLLRQTITMVDGYVEAENKGWALLTMTIPPSLTRTKTPSFEIEVEDKTKTIDDSDVKTLFSLVLNHVDSMIEYAKRTNCLVDLSAKSYDIYNGFNLCNRPISHQFALEKWKKYQNDCYSPKFSDSKQKLLIEIGAQHPLLNGEMPNEEFQLRLNKAIEIYQKNKDKYEVYFYVPGSLHCNDKISLSNAGKKYLIEKGIDEQLVFGEKENIKYKINGVYNTADECYVASQIVKDNGFHRVVSVCSIYQVAKKYLFYLANGINIEIKAVSLDNMFHDPLYEIIEILPNIIYSDNTWQDENSYYGNKSRRERKPK